MRRYAARLAGVLLVALTTAAVRATPVAAAAQLRAIQCCADHCRHEDPFAASRRCCVTSPDANHVATTPAVPPLPAPGLAALAWHVPDAPGVGGAATTALDTVPRRAGPTYLLTRAIRR